MEEITLACAQNLTLARLRQLELYFENNVLVGRC